MMPERGYLVGAQDRLEVAKTYKLFIGGQFARSESGRSLAIEGAGGRVLAHVSHASRKDFRNAVEAAAAAQAKWAEASAYNRGQVLYRMAEMLEGKRAEFAEVLETTGRGGAKARRHGSENRATREATREVEAAIDRLVCFAGWADKYSQVLGCNNPVAGPYYNFTVPEPTGIVAVIAPDEPSLLGLISLLAPPLCAGNVVVALGSGKQPLATAILGEVCATSDIPPGVINILTGVRAELLPHIASHREVNAIHGAGLGADEARVLRAGAADNVKRVTIRPPETDWFDEAACHSPWWIEPFVEMKTIWHPSGA
jgi:acyl-CoA reductase-like NAD-dependent aldehyde dehydrogenase